MKKNFILLLAIAALSSNMLISQELTQDLKSNYVRFQNAYPIGEYSDFYRGGAGAEFGKFFYFNTMWFDCITPGIDITFAEVALNIGRRFNYNEQGDIIDRTITRNGVRCFFHSDGGFFSTLSVKVGPAFTYNLIDDLFADLSIKYAPTFAWGSRSINFVDMNNDQRAIDDQSSMFAGFAHRLSTGINIKYKFFTFGVELLFGKTTLNYAKEIVPQEMEVVPASIIPGVANGDTWRLIDEKKMGLNTFKVSIGYLF